MKHLYLSANHVSRANTPYFLDALKDYQIDHIVGYSSSLAVLARETLQLVAAQPFINGIITMAEPLNSQQRDVIKAAFGCEVRETYGMSELVAMATECDSGTLHLWPEVGWLETFADHEDRPLAAGSAGRLVCTSLMNTDMPLIRYIVGDRGRISSGDPSCGCGRNLPSILSIEGRTNDLLLTRDGREVYWLNPVFYGLPLIEAQIIQESLDTIRILYVPTISFTKEHEDLIATRLKLRFGEVDVVLEAVPSIPRASNGKFRAVVCNLSDLERNSARKSSVPSAVAQ
jgi:phenylacetate-CoA ligase